MAIAGIKPAAFATSELGSMEDAVTSITDNTMKPISLPSGTALYTEEQVHEIIMKAAQYWIETWDWYDDEPIDVDYDGEVLEFMESDGE